MKANIFLTVAITLLCVWFSIGLWFHFPEYMTGFGTGAILLFIIALGVKLIDEFS